MPALKTHDLKCWPPYFEEVVAGRKTFELRRHDRDFRVGDVLRLREWDNERGTYTGRRTLRRVTYILYSLSSPFGTMIAPGCCLMSIEPLTVGG